MMHKKVPPAQIEYRHRIAHGFVKSRINSIVSSQRVPAEAFCSEYCVQRCSAGKAVGSSPAGANINHPAAALAQTAMPLRLLGSSRRAAAQCAKRRWQEPASPPPPPDAKRSDEGTTNHLVVSAT